MKFRRNQADTAPGLPYCWVIPGGETEEDAQRLREAEADEPMITAEELLRCIRIEQGRRGGESSESQS